MFEFVLVLLRFTFDRFRNFIVTSVFGVGKEATMAAATETRSLFVAGLRNAHAMENQGLSTMRHQLARPEKYPDVAARLERHIDETVHQVRRLEEILHQMGEDHSTVENTAFWAAGGLGSFGYAFARDEALKHTIANFAFENYEIATYRSLLTIVDLGSFPFARSLLEASLREEKSMAAWLDGHIRALTIEFTSLQGAAENAKT